MQSEQKMSNLAMAMAPLLQERTSKHQWRHVGYILSLHFEVEE